MSTSQSLTYNYSSSLGETRNYNKSTLNYQNLFPNSAETQNSFDQVRYYPFMLSLKQPIFLPFYQPSPLLFPTQEITQVNGHKNLSPIINASIWEYHPEENMQSSKENNIFSAIPRKHQKQRAVTRGFYDNSKLCRVYELNMNDPRIRNIPRAGIVFYTFINNELFLCFGRDRESKELTDFGGGRRTILGETSLQCAIREGNEESRHAFSEIKPEQIEGFYCLHSNNMLIIFVPVASPNEMDIREITSRNFNKMEFLDLHQKTKPCYNEISEIVWLNERQIENLFSKHPQTPLFAKVRRFIYSCSEFSQNIAQMKAILKSAIGSDKSEVRISFEPFYMYSNETTQKVQYHNWTSDSTLLRKISVA